MGNSLTQAHHDINAINFLSHQFCLLNILNTDFENVNTVNK